MLFCSLASTCMHIHVHLHKMSTYITQEACICLGTHTCRMHCMCYVLHIFNCFAGEVFMHSYGIKKLILFWNKSNGLMNIRQHDPKGWSLNSPSWRGIRAKVPQRCQLLACVQCLDTCHFSYESTLHLQGGNWRVLVIREDSHMLLNDFSFKIWKQNPSGPASG